MKQLRLDQAIKYLTCGDPACGNWTGSKQTEKERGRVPPGVFLGWRWEKRWWDFVCAECLGLMIWLMLVLLISFSRMVGMVLV